MYFNGSGLPRPVNGSPFKTSATKVYEHEGIIEIGYNPDSPSSSFIRAIDLGGAHWEGETEYDSLDDALVDLETGIEQRLQEIYGE
jgi:hypothetical protein